MRTHLAASRHRRIRPCESFGDEESFGWRRVLGAALVDDDATLLCSGSTGLRLRLSGYRVIRVHRSHAPSVGGNRAGWMAGWLAGWR